MMKLSEFIQKTLAETTAEKVEFDLSIILQDKDIIVYECAIAIGETVMAENRIRFTVERGSVDEE